MNDTFEGGDASVAIDLTDVQEASFEAVPVGEYDAVIANAEYKLSQSSGSPMWSLQLQIVGGDYDNRRIFDNISFSEKALPYTKKTIATIAPELLSGPFDPEEAAADLQGKEVRIKTKMETYQGEKSARVKQYVPMGGNAEFMNG